MILCFQKTLNSEFLISEEKASYLILILRNCMVSGFALDPLMNMSKIKFPKPKMTHDRIKLYAQLECTSTFQQKTPYFKDNPFETLNNLADEKPISQFQNTKSVTLTDAGRQKAEQRKKQKLDCLPPHKSFMTAVN